MVKCSPESQPIANPNKNESQNITQNLLLSLEKFEQEEQYVTSSDESEQFEDPSPWKPKILCSTDHVEKYNNTIVGCLINYMRPRGPTRIEDLIDHVKTKMHKLKSLSGKPYRKNAVELVDYALTNEPKIFLLNDSFHYYLNEDCADAYEKLHKRGKNRKKEMTRQEEAENYKKKRNKHKEIKTKIQSQLEYQNEDVSTLIKAYAMLTSENPMVAAEVKFRINDLYRALK
ncbi:unnamed protein product [Blepharisma stoltei]|uniref:Uncharacterized protein n=1 Tax=Blepharisma stoltei TaxID=1481888 RepID=A0AAU9JRT1_9CILI|nr:unnamed protein product [Blepharisma stoltei]